MSMMTWKEAQKEKFHGMQSVQQQERVMIWRLYLVYAKKWLVGNNIARHEALAQ